ncbi:hypothetical protein CCP4SC76_2480008 [Gammaproteobacteria bacterium]
MLRKETWDKMQLSQLKNHYYYLCTYFVLELCLQVGHYHIVLQIDHRMFELLNAIHQLGRHVQHDSQILIHRSIQRKYQMSHFPLTLLLQ